MRSTRIKAILLQEFFITKRSLEIIIDLFYFAVIGVILFGFVAVYLVGSASSTSAHYILLGVLLWEIMRITQYSTSVGSLWEIWSRNLSNIFISPLSAKEYLFAQMISGVLKTLLIFTIASLITSFMFGFNILQVGFPNLLLFFINLSIFAWSLGLLILGLILRFGQKIQSFAWSLIFLFQPLSANLFPVDVLPPLLRYIAYLLPPTHVFEAARNALRNPSVNWYASGLAFGENILYFSVAVLFFRLMLNKSKQTGQFAKMEV